VATKVALGEVPAFFAGWSYWCGCWLANGTIILGGVSYLGTMWPAMNENGIEKFILIMVVVWFYTILNIVGVKESAVFNLVITLAKLIPIVVIIVIAALNFDSANLSTVSNSENAQSGIAGIGLAMTYTLWSFLGFEGIAVNAQEVKNPKMIRKGTIWGMLIVLAIYVVMQLLAAGNLDQQSLYESGSPFADIISNATGASWAGNFIAITVCVSAFGCIGAWILSAASTAYSLGEQGLMPKSFAKLSPKRSTPVTALVINGILMTIVLSISFLTDVWQGFGSLYNVFLLLSTLALLIFYAFGAATEMALAAKGFQKLNVGSFLGKSIISLVAFIYSLFTIYGSGGDYVMPGFILMLIGLPFYVYVKSKRYHEGELKDGEIL
jgi:amino acid transporter